MEDQIIQNFDEKYQVKSEIDHVLDRPGTWVGSIQSELIDYLLFQPSTNKIIPIKNVSHNSGLLKLVDEVLSNAVDEHRRKDSLFKVTEIDVQVFTSGRIIIKDNGGIPVQIHKGTKLIIPEMIFGHFRTSSNYDDTQERDVVGTNGLGAKLTNIFSKYFTVQTCDTKNSISVEWTNNMKESNKDLKKYPGIGFLIKKEDSKDINNHGTRIEFQIDLDRFDLEQLNLSTIRIIQKRCIDAAATNPGLKISFSSDIAEGKLNSEWIFDSFKDYVKLYLTPEQTEQIRQYKNRKDDIILLPSIGFNFGFVNGGICSAGTHMKKIEKQIVEKILKFCAEADMELITEKDITNRISIFANTSIPNPSYNSQTKETLTTKIDKYLLNISEEFLNALKDSEIFESLKDYYTIKYAEEKKKETKKLNATIKITKIKKLIMSANPKAINSELWLFEGDSAANGFRKHSDKMYQSAYLLRGKIKNTFNLKKSQVLENQELREVIAALGILFDEPKKNLLTCRFAKIVIGSDMDHDGDHICGLLIAFFAKHFPELFRINKIYRSLSPIVVVSKKGQKKEYFYTLEDFANEEHRFKTGWEIIYTKGLGGLCDEDYRQMLHQKKLIQFSYDEAMDLESVVTWFAKSTDQRKALILEDSGEGDS